MSDRNRGSKFDVIDRLVLNRREYLIVKELSRNSLQAFDPRAQAMRLIRVRADQPGGRALNREMRLMRRAAENNPNLARVIEYARLRERHYLVLEWTEGLTLGVYVRKARNDDKQHFEVAKAHQLVTGLARGLNRLHQLDLYHLDIKPDNLVLARPYRLVMIDFGESFSGARASQRNPSVSGPYAAPEQFSTGLADHRTDQFAASVILYELLTNKSPYDGLGGRAGTYSNPVALVPSLQHNRNVPSALDRVVARGLELNPRRRYPTTGEWVQELAAALPFHTRDQRYPDSTGVFARLARGVACLFMPHSRPPHQGPS